MANIRQSTGTNSSLSKILDPKLYHIAVVVKNNGNTSALRYVGLDFNN